MMALADRAPLALVIFAIALGCDALLTARDGFGIALPGGASEREERNVSLVRAGIWLGTVGFALFVLTRGRPDFAFGATAAFALLAPLTVQAGASFRGRRHADPAEPGPRLSDPAEPLTTGGVLSWPLQLLQASALVVVCLFFRWTLPHLPSVAPLHWGGDGNVYTSPTRLWWSLAIVAFNAGMILFAAFSVRGSPTEAETAEERILATQRRSLSVRLVETLLVGLDLVAMAMWVAAILALVPGQARGVAPAGAIVSSSMAAGVLVLALVLYLPPLFRIRRALRRSARERADAGADQSSNPK
jgi:hypothetical protein